MYLTLKPDNYTRAFLPHCEYISPDPTLYFVQVHSQLFLRPELSLTSFSCVIQKQNGTEQKPVLSQKQ